MNSAPERPKHITMLTAVKDVMLIKHLSEKPTVDYLCNTKVTSCKATNNRFYCKFDGFSDSTCTVQ